jgi:hypothetical protein
MNKNKIIIFSILLIIAVGFVWFQDYLSSQPPSEEESETGVVIEPKVVRDFKAFCDTLSSSKWEPQAFQERVDRLNVYQSKDIVNATEFVNLQEYMYSAYASSLNNSYSAWKNTCDVSQIKALQSEMKRIKGITQTGKNKLEAPLNEINGFFALLAMSNKVDHMIRLEYNEAQFNLLINQVQALPNYFSRCTNVNKVKRESENALLTFKKFAIDYNDDLNSFRSNPRNSYTRSDLRKLCKQAKLNNYNHYSNLLNDLNVCL